MSDDRYAFCVAVVGPADVMSADELERLIERLVARHRDTRRIVLISAGRDSPELRWCQNRNWTLWLEPACGNPVKQDCALIQWSDAILVLGDPAPWQRLLALAKEARIPVRVCRQRPKLPAIDPPGSG